MRLKLAQWIPEENELQEEVVGALDVLLLPPARYTALNMGHVLLSAAQAARVHRMGCKRAWPDLLIIHGRAHGIELKRPGGRLSVGHWDRTRRGAPIWREGQAEEFPRLKAAGMPIAVCTSWDEVRDALTAWGVPLRTHALT